MSVVLVECGHCGKSINKERSAVNRAHRDGYKLYCDHRCSGAVRRIERSVAERKRMKAEYDVQYRAERRPMLLEKKRAYHRRTYTPERGRMQRASRSFDHTAYCRRYYADPTKKAEKVQYDRERRARLQVAEFAECLMLLNELWKEIRRQEPSWYERAKTKGFLLKLREKKHERQERCTA